MMRYLWDQLLGSYRTIAYWIPFFWLARKTGEIDGPTPWWIWCLYFVIMPCAIGATLRLVYPPPSP